VSSVRSVNPATRELIARDLRSIIEWAQQELAYVESGMVDHAKTVEDEVFYYRYIRKVACSR
jgi:hypothetical protein